MIVNRATAPCLCRVLGRVPGAEQCWSAPDYTEYLFPESVVEDEEQDRQERAAAGRAMKDGDEGP